MPDDLPEADEASGHYIVVDWGTSQFRAYWVDAHDTVLATHKTSDGIHTISSGRFAEVLHRAIQAWLPGNTTLPVYACGMVTSRNGWKEMPYVPCPVDAQALATAMQVLTTDKGFRVHFVPGVIDQQARPFPDVMRGEETQIIGADIRDGQLLLPGTHSKWVEVESGYITSVRTAVTGELYALLREHSLVAGGTDQGAFDEAAFMRGVSTAQQAPQQWQHHLFGVRSGVLSGALTTEETGDYLSGLLIGHEFSAQLTAGTSLTLIGSSALMQRYQLAASAFGITATTGHSDAVVRGIAAIRKLERPSSRTQVSP